MANHRTRAKWFIYPRVKALPSNGLVTRERLNAKKRRRRILWISVIIVVAALIVVVALIATSSQSGGALTKFINQPVSPAVSQSLSGVSDSTLAAVGAGQHVTAPSTISGQPLTNDSKPEVFYVGGDYCPYCSIERWGIVVALSKFGNFSNLQYMLSSSTDVYPNTPTFTFRSATYSSPYISFVAVEEFGSDSTTVVQALSSDQQALVSQYDSGGSIPFLDIGNSYTVVGAQINPDTVTGHNWTQIASALNNPNSSIAMNIDAAANYIISAICKVDGGKPTSICGQSYAILTLAFLPQGSSSSSTNLLLSVRKDERWTI